MILTREEILTLGARREVKSITIPEWSGDVYVREITAGERDTLEMMQHKAAESGNAKLLRGNWVAMFLSDKEGARLCPDGDIHAISNMGAKAIDRIFEAGYAFNKLGDLDELEKNSEAVT